jgi:nucleotide-binding universal stress UspA family protein
MQHMALVVGTDGSPEHDTRVREAAITARDRSVPLHVVCSVEPVSKLTQRKLDAGLPADCTHMAGASGQRNAAVLELQAMLAQSAPGVDVRVTATAFKLSAAERAIAARTGAEVYGARKLRSGWLPVLRLRSRATA